MDSSMEDVEKLDGNTGQRTYMGEIGVRGLERYGGYIYEEFLPNLKMPQSLKVYKEMSSNDATIGTILFIYEQMIRRVKWTVPPVSKKRIDKQVAQFIQECMNDMSHTWIDLITEACSMFTYGWSWHELCYKYRNGENRNPDKTSKFNDNRIGWSKIPIRSQNSWNRWIYDDNDSDKLLGMEQNAANVGKSVIIPWEKSLHFVTKPNRGNPEGESLLRRAYKAYYYKKKEEELEGIGIERNLAGLPVITPPLEAANLFDTTNPEMVTMLNNLKTMVSNIRMDKYMGVVLPPGYTLELKSSSSGQRQSGTNEIINRWDQRIAITLLADIIFLGSDKSGSFALADVKKSLLAYALESQLLNMANVINQFAIPRLLRLNTFMGYTDYPKAIPGEIETPDMLNLAEAMSKFAELGMKFFPQPKLERYINNNFGFPELTEEEIEERDKKIEEENKKQEKIIEENKKKLDISQKIGNNTNSQNNKGTKNLTTRETKPKQTDDKTKFNATYERTGQK